MSEGGGILIRIEDSRESMAHDTKTPRRRFLEIAGTTGLAAGLAGCSSNGSDGGGGENGTTSDGEGNETESDGQSSELVDSVFNQVGGLFTDDVTQLQFNPYNLQSYTGNAYVFERLGKFDAKKFLQEQAYTYLPRAAKSWDLPDKLTKGATVTITAADDRTWHDGDPVTADDLYTKFRLEEAFNGRAWDHIDNLQRAGENSIELTLKNKTNTEVFKRDVLDATRLNTKYSIWQDKLEQLESASTESEREDVVQEISNWRLEEGIGTGVFKLTERIPEKKVYEPHENHPVGKQYEFDQLEYRAATSNQKKWQAALGGQTDNMASFTPKDVTQKILDTDDFGMMIRMEFFGGLAVGINNQRKPFDDPRVRKALAYAINRDAAAAAAGKVKGPWGQIRSPDEVPTGIFVGESEWLDGILDSFETYGYDSSETEKAAALLQDAGFTKESGTWMTPSGDPFQVPIQAPGGISDYVSGVQLVAGNLKEMGIDSSVQTLDNTTHSTRVTNGEFTVTVSTWGNGVYPYFMFLRGFENDFYPNLNVQPEVEVPMPAGDPDGSLQTVNTEEKMTQLASTTSEQEARKIIRELAWVYNNTIPQIPISIRHGQVFLDTTDWNWPPKEEMDALYYNAKEEIMRRGLPSAKTA